MKSFKSEISRLDQHIITPLWREWNRWLVNPFAEVNYGYSTTVHKSQGSTYYNVFADVHDILENTNTEEMKRCLYTALTRTSNQLHMLI